MIHNGLTTAQVEESRRLHGDNILTPPKRKPLWKQFLAKFDDPLIKILLVALMLSVGIACYEFFHLGERNALFEPIGIFIAIVLATLVGFIVEVNANSKFEQLNRSNDDIPVKVARGGRITTVPRRDIVVGDIVMLDTGDRVPADGILIDSVTLSVDESSLTGEPIAHKTHRPRQYADQEHKPTYPANALMRSSAVTEGHGVMEVTAVGDQTEFGKVFAVAKEEIDLKTPLMQQFDRLGRLIAHGSYVIAALIIIGRLAVYFIDDTPFDWLGTFQYFIQTVMLAVTLIVVSVPEGLPMSVTLSMALSMRRMLKHNNLVRRMHATETMGAVTVICTDKTGTLTENQMRVSEAHLIDDNTIKDLIPTAIACNSTAFLDDTDPERPIALGNPTEGALLLWLRDNNVDYLTTRETHDILDQMPFSTERKMMATITIGLDRQRILLVKGAPEYVMSLCDIPPEKRSADERQLASLQGKAMRTLALAWRRLEPDETASFKGIDSLQGLKSSLTENDRRPAPLVYMGYVAISDPVRTQVPKSIEDCRNAGIEVKIITGDTAATAREVARQTGIWTDSDTDDSLITGDRFAALDDQEATKVAKRLRVMSRARPTDKARLVDLLQKAGEVVAVTGDGTNDAPALNVAQVGLSMGDGTSVAKEASDITILDNSFTSINKAVLWGRSLYRNIQRFITFQLTVNVCACLVVALCAFISRDQVPLTVTQMLWVNLIMDTFAALALAALPPNSIVMRVPPRRAGENIITHKMAWFIIGVGVLTGLILTGLFHHMLHGDSMLHARIDPQETSVYFTTFVFFQWWNLFNVRALGSGHSAFHNLNDSKIFLMVVVMILVGQVVIIQLLGTMFGCQPMPLDTWLIIAAATSPVLLIGEGIQFFKRMTK